MNTTCAMFRSEWLARGAADPAHAVACTECARWVRETERQLDALARLERLVAPAELDLRVAAELAGDRSRRLARALGGLTRLPAPTALDERVDAELRSGPSVEAEEFRALPSLETRRAPHVLERLLDDELAAPERARVERFSGSLERVLAPHVLERRLGSAVRRRAIRRLVLAPIATLAAAGLVVWLAVRGPEPAHVYRFEVVQATSLDELDPMARGLAESLSGGPRRGDAR